MLPAGQDAAEAFYRITDAAYERRSLAVTSNIHPSVGFDELMPKTLATATVDSSCTTPTYARPPATASACPRPSPGRESSRWSKPTRAHLMAATGQIPWPSAGRTRDRHWADLNVH
jgi:hypothetical protein